MVARPHIIKAAIYLKKGEIQKADSLMREAEELLKKAKYSEEELLYFEYAYQLSQKQKNYEKSLLYFQKYINLKDSVQSTRNYKAALQNDFEYNEKINEKNREIERDKEILMRVYLYFGLCILLVLLFFVFRAFYIKSKNLTIISQKKVLSNSKMKKFILKNLF